jgi:hypothetical protein
MSAGKICRTTTSYMICTAVLAAVICSSGCGAASSVSQAAVQTTAQAAADGKRDNTPYCPVPEASGKVVYGNDLTAIDASNAADGYVMVIYKGSVKNVKLQITCPDTTTYTYNLSSEYQTFPLTSDSGTYHFAVYENVKDNQYSTAFSQDAKITVSDPFGPYLYTNQYIRYDSNSKTVAKGAELAKSASSDLDVISNVYNYIIKNIKYDYDEAENVQSGYIPDVDKVLEVKKGICLDYASVMTCMLRSQHIPTRMEVGYAGTAYHAWISTYIKDKGWVNGIIQFDGKSWQLMDPTFGSTSDSKKLRKFIGDGDNYKVKYIY